jgi:hypothetical protein
VQPELAGVGWDLTGQGNGWILLWHDNGVTPGEWEFRLYLMDKLVQRGTFTVEKRQANAPYFDTIRFAEGIKDDKPVNLQSHGRFQSRNQRGVRLL